MSGKIPQSFIDELMTRIDVVELIDTRVPLKKAGREYTACCPFHNEKTPSFTVSPTKQFYHCFGCGAHGTALGFLMEYEHMSFPEAVEDLARMTGQTVPREGPDTSGPPRPKKDGSLYELLARSDRFYRQQLRQHPQAQRAIDYLKQRGLSGEIAAVFGVGFAPPGWDNLKQAIATQAGLHEKLISGGMLIKNDNGDSYDRFRDRIMFPIRDRRGRTIAFGGRILPDTEEGRAAQKAPAKYLNSPETPLFHKGQELYGMYEARQALRDIPCLLVVEGYMDVVALAQFDIRYAVATLGTATTQEHLHRLFRLAPEVVFCFDGDRAGRDAAWRALNNALPVMREGRQIRFMFLPDGEDPDSHVRAVGKIQFEAEIGQAQPFSDFFFQQLGQQTETQSIDGRARLVALARPLLANLPPGVFRHMMLNQLASLARMESSELERLLTDNPPATRSQGRTVPRRPLGTTGANRKQPFSPVRTALKHLLYHPPLVAEAGDPSRFRDLDVPGINLLVKILETLQAHPNLNSSALLERWRDSEHGPHLEKLIAQVPELDDPAALKPEFLGALQRLDRLCLEQRYNHLLVRSNQGELTPEEKREIQQLTELLNRDKRQKTSPISE